MSDDIGPDVYWWLHELDLGTVDRGSAGAPVGALGDAPETVVVAGSVVRVETYLNRDFQPICPPGGYPLMASVRVYGEPALLPTTFRAERIIVVYGDEVWVAPLVEEDPGSRTPASFQALARQGPKWPPGVTADVVVQFRDAMRKLYLVRAPGQLIQESS